MSTITINVDAFLAKHQLPESYIIQACQHFKPLINELKLLSEKQQCSKALIVGISGAQGSGKTTLADYLSLSFQALGLKSLAMSIDDFYLTRKQRQQLAKNIHPLLITRGVPGTHDMPLALATLSALSQQQKTSKNVAVPSFDKASDDRNPKSKWQKIQGPLDIIILEGWCIAVPPQEANELSDPINALESKEDKNAHWRHWVNNQLQTEYSALWRQLDYLIFLKAPSFDCISNWRYEQEEKLYHATSKVTDRLMNKIEINRFISHYERLTRHAIANLGPHCDKVFLLDRHRKIISG